MGYTGIDCASQINYCSSLPCLTGKCINNSTYGTYSCSCPVGFYGVNCENAINQCGSNPCLNSGSCFNLATGSYKFVDYFIYI